MNLTNSAMDHLWAIFMFAAYMVILGISAATALGVWAGYILDTVE